MYWVNSAFQTLYFIVGKCHTFDEAYRVVLQQLEERECALEETQEKADHVIRSLPENSVRLNQFLGMIDATRKEIHFLKTLAARIEPLRKYRDLPLHDANQLAQRDQWLGEFMNRIENFIFTTGVIPPDAMDAMRLHPDYEATLLPHMKRTMAAYQRNELPPPKQSPVVGVMKMIEGEQVAKLAWTPKEIAA